MKPVLSFVLSRMWFTIHLSDSPNMGIQNTTCNKHKATCTFRCNSETIQVVSKAVTSGGNRENNENCACAVPFLLFLFVPYVAACAGQSRWTFELEHVTLCPSIVQLRVRAGIVNSVLSREAADEDICRHRSAFGVHSAELQDAVSNSSSRWFVAWKLSLRAHI